MENIGFPNKDICSVVLSRLPTKDLLRLKFVCKGWCQLISDRGFWRVQSRRKKPISGFFLQEKYKLDTNDKGDKQDSDDNEDELDSDGNGEKVDPDDNGDKLDQDDNGNKLKSAIITLEHIPVELRGPVSRRPIFDFIPADVKILASCNGLICCRSSFSSQDPSLYVCNPLNKEWMRLSWTKPDIKASIGLSFDPCQDIADSSTQFKLVSVQQFVGETEDSHFLFNIYSSDTGLWTKSRKSCHQRGRVIWAQVIYVEGVLYWFTDFGEIVAFSVEKDTAWEISAPDSKSDLRYSSCIGESDGQLHYVMTSNDGLHIWSREDYVESEWNLKYSRSSQVIHEEHPRLIRSSWPMEPLAFQDGYILMNDGCGIIFLYNIETHKMDEVLLVSELPKWTDYTWSVAFTYSMSLVPLNSA